MAPNFDVVFMPISVSECFRTDENEVRGRGRGMGRVSVSVSISISVSVTVKGGGVMSNESVTEWYGKRHFIHTISLWCAPFDMPPPKGNQVSYNHTRQEIQRP